MTPSTAGTESSAKTMSVVSMMTSATKSGVASRRPPCLTRKRPPDSTGVIGIRRATHVEHTEHAAATTWRSLRSPQTSRTAAKMMNAANG